MKPWAWKPCTVYLPPRWSLVDGRGRERCTIFKADFFERYTWHTWDENGTGGENSTCSSLNDAKDQAMAAIVRQGWAPGGWRVTW